MIEKMPCVHYWVVDNKDIGTCKYCGEVRDFGSLYRRGQAEIEHRQVMIARETCKSGKPRGRKRKNE